MNYHYLSILFFFACPPIASMEQGALLLQKPVLKTVPSLKELALKAYARVLHGNAPQEMLSEAQIVDWCIKQGLECFFDLNCGDLILRLRQLVSQLTVIKTGLQCPTIFSCDGSCAFFYDYKTRRIVDAVAVSGDAIEAHLEFGPEFYGQWPIFSPDAQWILGWEKGSTLILIPSALSSSMANRQIIRVSLADHQGDATFLDANTILVRTRTGICVSSIADFVSKGTNALTQVYSRNDMQEYNSSLFYRTIHALSDSCIACVGPNKKSIEILKRDVDGNFSLVKTLAVPNIFLGNLVVHNARGIAAMHVSPANKAIHLCQLLGDDAGKKSTIAVEGLHNYLFSPSGEYLACGTDFKRQVIEIFDCKNLVFPQRMHIIPQVVKTGPAIPIIWTERELVVSDGCGKKSTITFNSAAPLVKAYLAHREKQKKVTDKKPS